MKQKERNLVHWSPKEYYDRSTSLRHEIGDGKIYCQAVVQLLFADTQKAWTVGEIGELVLYKPERKKQIDSTDLFLSFFASERYRFLIKMSDGAKVWHASRNFVAIQHGRLIGLNFSIEHVRQAELLVRYMHGHSTHLLPGRFLRGALEHFQIRRRSQKLSIEDERPTEQIPPKPKVRKSLTQREDKVAGSEEPDPILQPREFLQKMSYCSASADI